MFKCLNAIYFVCKQHIEHVEHSVNLQVFLRCTRPEGYLQFPGRAAHTAGTPRQKISVVLKVWLFQTTVYLEASNGSVTSRCYQKTKRNSLFQKCSFIQMCWLGLTWFDSAQHPSVSWICISMTTGLPVWRRAFYWWHACLECIMP